MSDKLQLELDGSEIIAGVKETLSALAELKAAIAGFANNSPTGRVRAEVQALSTTALTVVQSVEKTLGGVQRAVQKSMEDAARSAKKGGRAVADAAGQGLDEGIAALRAKSASNIDPRTILGLDADRVRKSAKASAELFSESFRAQSAGKLDPRTLLGLPSRDEAKSIGAQIAAQFRDGVATESLRARGAVKVDPRTLLGLPPDVVQKSAKASAAAFQDAFISALNAQAGTARAQVTAAMAAPAGAYSVLGGARHGATVTPKQAALEIDSLAHSMRGAHSAARGLASGFGAIWLTWGQLGPLLAGAAVSHAFVQSIKRGSEFEQTLEAIGNMAEVSARDLDRLSASALELGRVGPFGPNEIATALKSLALAGLSAREQLEAIKPVLNFALAGEIPVQKAAESLVGISTAFGYTATGFSAVGDVIAKAAAISMASVESMTESFKTASTVAQQFGVSVTDAATTLALLSQMGIKGTAAGTAMRNMYNELIGTSKEAKKVLKDVLNIDVIDNASKAMKPLAQILSELSASLSKYDFRSQLELLQALGNERGMKALAADLTAFVTAAKEAGRDVTTEFERIQRELQDAPGFVAMAAAGMAQTTANQMKSVGTALQSTLIEAFQNVNSEVQTTAKYLRDLFNSPEFRRGIESLTSSLSTLVRKMVEHADVLQAVALGYVGGKAAAAGYAIATNAAASAQVALGASALGASAGIRLILASLGPIGAALALAGTAYLVFGQQSETASEKAARAAKSHSESLAEAMDKEIQRLDEQMKARREGVDANLAAAKTESELAISRVLMLHDEERAAERTRHAHVLLNAQRTVDKITGTPYAETAQGARALAQAEAQIAESRNRLADVVVRQTGVEQALYEKQRVLFAKAQQDAKEAEAEAKQRRNAQVGTRKFETPDFASASAEYRQGLRDINLFMDAARQMGQEVDEQAKFAQEVLQQSYDRGALSFSEYQERLNAIQSERTSQRLAILRDEHDAATYALEDLRRKAGGLDPTRSPDKQLANDAAQLQTKLEQSALAIKKAYDDAYLAQGKALTDLLKPSAELVRNSEKDLATLENNLQQELQRLAVKENINELSEREQYIQAQVLKGTNAMVDKLVRYQSVLKQQLDSGVFDDLDNPDVRRNFEALLSIIDRLKVGIEDASGRLQRAAAAAFDAKKINEIARGLNDGFTDALFEGSGKKLRKTLEEELLKKPFRMVVQAFLQPITHGLAGMAYGAIAGGPGSMLSSTAGTVAGNAAWNYLSGGTTRLLGSGTTLGNMFAGATGVGGSFASSVGAGLATDAMGATVAQGTAAATLGPASSIGSTLMTAAPYIAVGAMLLGSFLKKGGGPKADGVFGQINSGIGLGVRTPELAAAAETTARGMQAQFDVLQRQLGGTGAVKFGVGISTDPKGTSPSFLDVTGTRDGRTLFTSLDRNVGRSESDLQAALAKATTEAMFAGLKASQLEKDFQEFFDGIASDADLKIKEASLKTASEVASYTEQIRFLGGAFEQLASLSVDARGSLLDAAGGLSALSQATGSYVQNFYSDEERRTITAQQISRALGPAGLNISSDQVLGATRAQFRALVDSLDVTTEAGQRSYIALMSVADAFASITEAGIGAEDAAERVRRIDQAVGSWLEGDELRAYRISQVRRGVAGTSLETITEDQIGGATRASVRQLFEHLLAIGDTKAADALLDVSDVLLDIVSASESAAKSLEELGVSLQQRLDGAVASWLDGTELLAYRADQVRRRMLEVGVDIPAERILRTTKQEIREMFDHLVDIGNLEAAHALLDVSDALQDIIRPAEEAAKAVERSAQALQSAGGTISLFVRDLIATRAGTATPKESLEGLRSNYLQDLALARAGDLDANQRITQSAQAYIEAQKGYGASGSYTQSVISQVISDLQSLPSVKSYEARSLEALTDIIDRLDDLPDGIATALAPALAQIDTQLSTGFDTLDTNLSGYIDPDEFATAFGRLGLGDKLEDVFNILDANGDGQISQLEAINLKLASLPGYIGDEFSAIDLDSSGGITLDEMKEALEGKATDAQLIALFRLLDVDGDGTISNLEALNLKSDIGNATQGAILKRLNEDSVLSYGRADVAWAYNSLVANTSATVDWLVKIASFGSAGLTGSQTSTGSLLAYTTGSASDADKLAAEMAAYQQARNSGQTLAQYAAAQGYSQDTLSAWLAKTGLPAFADGGLHDGGLRLVGEYGPELEVTGPSRLYSAQETSRMLGVDNEALVAELKALRAEVAELRAEHRQGVVARNQATMAAADRTAEAVTAATRRQAWERQQAREAVPQ